MKYFSSLKKRSKTTITLSVLAVVLVAGIYACKKPDTGINLFVDTGLLSKAPTLIHFVNGNTTSPTALPNNFSVTISGTGAKYVQVDGGGQTFTTSNGYLPISLTRDAMPSAATPITFNVYASVPGFAPVSKTITIVKDTLLQALVPLVEYARPVDGTAALVTSTTLAAGTAPLTVLQLTGTATMQQTARITIPNGTIMRDAAGATINANTLNSSIIQYGALDQASAAATPGSLTANDAIGPNGVVLPGITNFVTAGMLAINMTAGNTPVKSFSQPVQVSIDLPAGYMNFDADRAAIAGDVIPLWSQDETTGQWKHEGTGTVSASGSGLVATFSISHLSYWNLDYYYYYNQGYPQLARNVCSTGITFKMIPSTTNLAGYYRLVWKTSGNNILTTSTYYPQSDGLTVVTPRTPIATNTKLYVYNAGGTLVGTSATLASCATGPVNVNFTTPPPPDLVNVKMNVKALCSNKKVVAFPSGWFYIYDTTTFLYNEVYIYNGTVYNYFNTGYTATSNTGKANGTYQLINGHSYFFLTSFSGTNYSSGTFVVNKNNVSIPATSGLSGSAVYSASTNTVSIDLSFTLTNCK